MDSDRWTFLVISFLLFNHRPSLGFVWCIAFIVMTWRQEDRRG